MPLYEIATTGELVSRSEDYVRAFPEGSFVLVEDESPVEKRLRLRKEALENKVDIDDDTEESNPPDLTVLGDSIEKEGTEYAY